VTIFSEGQCRFVQDARRLCQSRELHKPKEIFSEAQQIIWFTG
jgi:hypothetical protein